MNLLGNHVSISRFMYVYNHVHNYTIDVIPTLPYVGITMSSMIIPTQEPTRANIG